MERPAGSTRWLKPTCLGRRHMRGRGPRGAEDERGQCFVRPHRLGRTMQKVHDFGHHGAEVTSASGAPT
jgi:hypothetical protein